MNTKLIAILAAMSITGSAAATEYIHTTVIGAGTSQTTALRTTTGVRTSTMAHYSEGEGMESDGGSTTVDDYVLIDDSITSNNTTFDSISASYNGLRSTSGNSTTVSTVTGLTTLNGSVQFDSWMNNTGHEDGDGESTYDTDTSTTPYSYSTPFDNEYTTITNYQRVD